MKTFLIINGIICNISSAVILYGKAAMCLQYLGNFIVACVKEIHTLLSHTTLTVLYSFRQ